METQKKTKKALKSSKNDVFTMFIGAIAIPFLIVYYILYFAWRLVYRVFFALPNQRSILLGLFRVMLTFEIINYGGEYLMSYFPGDNPLIAFFGAQYEWVGQLLTFVLSVGLLISFFTSILVMYGMHTGIIFYEEKQVAQNIYRNISEALEFREGMLEQMTNSEKVKKMAKTGFVTENTFKTTSKVEAETFEYLNAQLGQHTNSGKVKFLEELFGHK